MSALIFINLTFRVLHHDSGRILDLAQQVLSSAHVVRRHPDVLQSYDVTPIRFNHSIERLAVMEPSHERYR